uniref:Translational regulator CsrA n=1 Tax=Schlesneria paludicola TaxID=360056 RepID=A0A7C2K1D1_9PLAN
MLVLTRKRGESISIDGRIEVRVLSVQGNRVRLGVTAPDSVSVRRGELVFDVEMEPNDVASLQEGRRFACV